MLEFKTMETLKPNTEILEIIKDYTYKVKKGTVKHLLLFKHHFFYIFQSIL